MGTPREILRYSIANVIIISICIVFFAISRISAFLYVPLILTGLLTTFTPLSVAVSIILTYVGFDGMLKVLSNYESFIHIGPDLLIVILTLRWLVRLSQLTGANKLTAPPLFFIFILHAFWVAIEILNPYGLGIIPGIAAYKVYGSFLTLYFFTYLAYDHVEQLKSLFMVTIVILGVQVVTSVIQFHLGEHSLLMISPYYAKPMSDQFLGSFFRPFGTSSVPGGPSTWCFLTTPLLLSIFLVEKTFLKKILIGIFVFAILYVLFICQVRSAMLRVPIGLAAAFVSIYWGRGRSLVLGVVAGISLYLAMQLFILFNSSAFEVARHRLQALSNFQYIMTARGSNFGERLTEIVGQQPFGIGLSRTGAAGNRFKNEIALDPFYGSEWAFADNLYLALVIELGVPGALIYLSLVYFSCGLIFLRMVRYRGSMNTARYLVGGCFGLAVSSIAGHWGSEGGLYLPECAYYWIFVGAGIKFSSPEFLNKGEIKIPISKIVREIARRYESQPEAVKTDGGHIIASGTNRS